MTSPQRRTALAFCHAFDHLDVDAHLALRTPDCVHNLGPASLGYPASMDNAQFADHLRALQPVISTFPVEPKEIFESGNLVTVWATSEAIFRDEVKDDDPNTDWKYHGEYMIVLVLTETGDKIKRIVEYLDSTKVVAVRALMEKAKENLAARPGQQ